MSARRPVDAGENTWPKLWTLKQSKSVTGAFPPAVVVAAPELHPVVDGEPRVYVVGLTHVIQFAECETSGWVMPATLYLKTKLQPVLECVKFAPPQLLRLTLSALRNDAVYPPGALARSHEKSKPTFTPFGPASLASSESVVDTSKDVATRARTPSLARVLRCRPNIEQISSVFSGR